MIGINHSEFELFSPSNERRIIPREGLRLAIFTQARLDRDGFVYFLVNRLVAPFTNTVRRVPVAGGASTVLSTFTTTATTNGAWLDISATRVGFAYPNSTLSGMVYSVVPKIGGVTTQISNNMVNGGMVGDLALIEDSAGVVRSYLLTDLSAVTRPNARLAGITYGGTLDWHYGMNPATSRFFISSISNQLKSYAIGENFSLTTAGIVMGTLPVNLFDLRSR